MFHLKLQEWCHNTGTSGIEITSDPYPAQYILVCLKSEVIWCIGVSGYRDEYTKPPQITSLLKHSGVSGYQGIEVDTPNHLKSPHLLNIQGYTVQGIGHW